MGFRRGSGSEKLLNCVACDQPMALDAEFCSECGAKRAIATGYEKHETEADPKPMVEETAKKSQVINRKLPSIRIKLGKQNEIFNSLLTRKRQSIFISAISMLFIASYVLIQTIIFSSQTTEKISELYIGFVASRDLDAINSNPTLFPNPNNFSILPFDYQKWDEVGQVSWKTEARWNGWNGRATVNFVPEINGQLDYTKQINVNLKAKYQSKALMFRELLWEVSTPIATLVPSSQIDANQKLYLNGEAAGTSESKFLTNAEYAVFPGPYIFKLVGEGFTKQRVTSFFIGSTGENKLSFEALSYELSSSQNNSATNQIKNILNTCLKRKCSDLPKLSQWDFDFSNQPTNYLYTDYFIYSWGSTAQCEPAQYLIDSADSASLTMKCTATASASVKWMLYKILFTTYYDLGYDYNTFNLTISADIQPLSNTGSVKVSNVQIID